MLSLYATIEEKTASRIARLVSYKRVGGLRFMRIGRLQFSFCVVNKKAAKRVAKRFPSYDASLRASHAATDALRPIYGASLNLCAASRAAWQAEYSRALKA